MADRALPFLTHVALIQGSAHGGGRARGRRGRAPPLARRPRRAARTRRAGPAHDRLLVVERYADGRAEHERVARAGRARASVQHEARVALAREHERERGNVAVCAHAPAPAGAAGAAKTRLSTPRFSSSMSGAALVGLARGVGSSSTARARGARSSQRRVCVRAGGSCRREEGRVRGTWSQLLKPWTKGLHSRMH
jgi:hypothetical protein